MTSHRTPEQAAKQLKDAKRLIPVKVRWILLVIAVVIIGWGWITLGSHSGTHCTQYTYVSQHVTACTQWTQNGH